MKKTSNKIILIGFMGSGKTTIAKALCEKLSLSYIETDSLVLKKSQRKSINEIFEKDKEPAFRLLEIETSKNLSSKNNCVISTGGGMIMNKVNIDYLRIGGKVLYLETSFEEIKKRLKSVTDRPLFKNIAKAQKLYNFRTKLYKEYADFVVRTDNKTVDTICNEIIQLVNK